jgi:aconitate hydratase
VLGGWANIATEYATKRYRSNLINWGMLPFLFKGALPFEKGDFIFVPGVREAIANKASQIKAYVIKDELKEFTLEMADLTDDERKIILSGCLINFYRS